MSRLNQHASIRVPVSVHTTHIDRVTVMSVVGEIDMFTEIVLSDAARDQLATRPRALVVDLSDVRLIGSAGIDVLIQTQTRADQAGTRFAVVAPEESFARRVFVLTGVMHMFDVHADRDSAVKAG